MARRRGELVEEDEKFSKSESAVNLGLNPAFEGYELSEFPKPPGGVLVLDSTQTILEALNVLLDKNILSAPVQDPTQSEDANWTQRYIGLVDMLDIVTFILAPFLEDDDIDFETSSTESSDFLSFLKYAREDASVIPLGVIMDIKRKHMDFGGLYPVYDFHTFLNALVALGKHQLHRLLIFPEKGSHLLNIVTQSAMCRVLQEKIDQHLDENLESTLETTTVADAGLGAKKDVYCVEITETALDAFMLIGKKRCGAVPVVNNKNDRKLVGNVSARDIRSVFLDKKMYKRMFEPLTEFLRDLRGDSIKGDSPERPMEVISCKVDESLKSVFQKVVGYKIHRVYCVNDQKEVLRVISLSDLLGVLIK